MSGLSANQGLWSGADLLTTGTGNTIGQGLSFHEFGPGPAPSGNAILLEDDVSFLLLENGVDHLLQEA